MAAPRRPSLRRLFVQGFDSRSPGMSGTSAVEPVAMTTALRATSAVLAVDVDRELAGEPCPAAHERDAALREPRHLQAVVEVVDHLVAPRAARRPRRSAPPRGRARARLRRRAPPGAAAPSTACTRRYEQSPPTSACSTIATDSPCSPSRPAVTSPAAPAPITTTSNSGMPSLSSEAGRCYVSAVATRWYSSPMSGLESTKSAVARLQAIGTL